VQRKSGWGWRVKRGIRVIQRKEHITGCSKQLNAKIQQIQCSLSHAGLMAQSFAIACALNRTDGGIIPFSQDGCMG
jgi:hypothetical protein